MTFTEDEIVQRVGMRDERVRMWRKWRRAMYLTIPEAAAMAGVGADWLNHIELGDVRLSGRLAARLSELMDRWDESKRPARKPDGRRVKKGRDAHNGAD